jgi:serine/threonine protein kinase
MGTQKPEHTPFSMPKTVEEFKVLKEIGNGSFGRVYLGMHLANDAYVAIKEAIPADSKKKFLNSDLLKNEANLLKQMKHPNVLMCYKVRKIFLFFLTSKRSSKNTEGHS